MKSELTVSKGQVQDEGITNKLTGWILVQDEIFRVVKITF